MIRRHLLACIAGFCALCSQAATNTLELSLLPGENWWAGVIAKSHEMPLNASSKFEFNFMANTWGNQGQPLLISDKGRYIWCEDPFAFAFDKGTITARSELGPLVLRTNGATLAEAYRHASRAFFPPSGKTPATILFTRPQFNTWIELTYNQNQKDILDYARKCVKSGYPPGVFMIDEGWARSYGDWDFNGARFPDPKAMIKELHKLGFQVMLWVCPHITSDGAFFKEMLLAHRERGEIPYILNANNTRQPVIFEWWDGFSSMLDLTNPYGRQWFKGHLDYLVKNYGVDGFKFDGGDASYYAMPAMLTPPKYFTNATPNQHSELYAGLGLEYSLNEFRACWKQGGQPLAQRLQDKLHSWEDLRKLVPGAINQGVMGYAFTCPDLIGGGDYLSFRTNAKIDQELIVRAAQCHALMPMMQFSVAPWRVLDKPKQKIALRMAELHTRMGGEILDLANASARTGEPIVRSLEYEFPGQGYGMVVDQFMLGQTILVAPVLEKGAVQRNVIFPPGQWQDEDGGIVQGPCEKIVQAPLERLPWFRKQPGADTKGAPVAAPAQRLIHLSGDVRITEPTVWENAHYCIRGNLYIEQGGTLKLENCTIELVGDYCRQFEIRWRGGRLVSRNSTLGGTLKDGIINTINFELAHGDWTATDTTVRYTSGIALGWDDKPVRFDATRLIQGPQCDSLIMNGKGQAILRDSTYNISLTADVKAGGKGVFDLPTTVAIHRTFDSSNVPGAAWRLELLNTKVPLWFLFVNSVSMDGPPADIELVRCSSLIPSIMGSNLQGEMRLPTPWPPRGAKPAERVLRTGNVTWRATRDDVSLFCWGVYLWGDKTDLTLTGKTLICELMLYEGRCALVGAPGTFETATTATTIEVGRNDPPSRAELTLRHVRIGRFDKNDSIKGQITAHGDSRVVIRDAVCADVVLVTRGKGEIDASGLTRQGRIISLPQGGPIRVDQN